MQVAYFSNQFADREGHGLARYARELFFALRELDVGATVQPVAAWSSLPQAELERWQAQTGLALLPWGRRLTPLTWSVLSRPLLESWLPGPPTLVHAVSLGYPIATRRPQVVTIHDIGPLTHPEFFPTRTARIMRRALRQAVDRAAALICVSQATADEVVEQVGAGIEDRLRVIHEGVNPLLPVAQDAEIDWPVAMLPENTPFIMATGKISPRKNTLAIIDALERLRDTLPHHLVLAGGDGWGMQALQSRLAQSPVRDRVHALGYVSDATLNRLYRQADLFVYPSLFEGFGLPILEAMAAGCPVVTSNLSSLPEVAGGAALLVDPRSPEALACTIEEIVSDSDLRASLVERGRRRADAMSWRRCAEQVMAVYQSVAHLGP